MLNLVVILAAAGWLAAFFLLMRLRNAQEVAPTQLSASNDAESKLDGLRKELAAAKDATERKAKQVEELRAEAKKKARREGKKEKAADAPAEVAAEAGDKELKAEVTRLKKAIVGLEKQIEITQKEAATTVADAEKIANENVAKKLEAEKLKAKEAVDARKKVEKTLEELRASIKKKAEARPDVPGSGLDLKALPTEAVQELSRYYRKAEHFEKLHSVAQGQLQLAQDRFNEQQKRYFAVCRELAVVAGKSPSSDVEARNIAESATQKTNAAVASAAPAPAANAADADDSDGEKKKRRRRRRKRKGDGTEAAGADDASANDNSDDNDGAAASESPTESSAASAAPKGAAPADAPAAEPPADSVVAKAEPTEKPQATAGAEG